METKQLNEFVGEKALEYEPDAGKMESLQPRAAWGSIC